MTKQNSMSAQKNKENTKDSVRRQTVFGKKRIPLFYYLIFIMCGIVILWKLIEALF